MDETVPGRLQVPLYLDECRFSSGQSFAILMCTFSKDFWNSQGMLRYSYHLKKTQ